MEKNVGGYDRIARLALGSVLLVVAVAGYAGFLTLAVGPVPQALMAVIVALLAIVLLATGATQKCGVNEVLGVNTHDGDGV